MEGSPKIVLPEDSGLRQQLEAKLVEYKGRYDEYRHPELQMDIICKIVVLEKLISDGKVDTFELSLQLADKYKDCFSVDSYNNACGVVEDYCLTGGKRTAGGTGLAESEAEKEEVV